MLSIKGTENGLILKVWLQPRSSRNQIVGLKGDALKIKLTAPPVDGKANKALLEFLAGKLGISKTQIEILSGHTTRQKQLEVKGINQEELLNLLSL